MQTKISYHNKQVDNKEGYQPYREGRDPFSEKD